MPSSSETNDAQKSASFSLPMSGTDAPVFILRDGLHSPQSRLPVSAIDLLKAHPPMVDLVVASALLILCC